MAMKMLEGWDWSTDILDYVSGKWSTTDLELGAALGRFGACVRQQNGGTRIGTKQFSSTHATWIIGMAVMLENTPGAGAIVFGMQDAATAQWEVRVANPSRALYIARNGTQLGSTSTTTLTTGIYYYVEAKVTINNTTGTAVLKINGNTEVNLSSQDTQNSANAFADTLRILPNGTSSGMRLDDMYVLDGSGGAPNNDFLGDIRIETLFPNGNGATSDFDGSDGNQTDNYLLVDENPPNDDTDYVESLTINDKDTYAMQNLATVTGTVYGVQASTWARKTDAGSRSYRNVVRLSGTDSESADHALTNGYQTWFDVFETKPGGGTWAIADVNSVEVGPKVTI